MVSLGPLAARFLLFVATAAAGHLSGSVKLEVRDGRPFVDGVYVNGHGPYLFLVDTGTNMNLIEPELARKIGMHATFENRVDTAAGARTMPGSDGNVVELGPVRAERQRFQFFRLDALHTLWPDADGVLGQSFLSRFDYLLDLRGKRLEFGRQEPTGSRSQARMLEGRPTITTSLGDMVLDSGAGRLVLFGVKPERDTMQALQTVVGTRPVGMVWSKLVIDGVRVWRGDAVAIPERREGDAAGLMPASIFKSIYVSNSEGYVVFE